MSFRHSTTVPPWWGTMMLFMWISYLHQCKAKILLASRILNLFPRSKYPYTIQRTVIQVAAWAHLFSLVWCCSKEKADVERAGVISTPGSGNFVVWDSGPGQLIASGIADAGYTHPADAAIKPMIKQNRAETRDKWFIIIIDFWKYTHISWKENNKMKKSDSLSVGKISRIHADVTQLWVYISVSNCRVLATFLPWRFFALLQNSTKVV